ncbi:MAG TPA: hypothetical protein VHO94_00240 [Oscillospiraceae bacterium]|nr:hypothetical protein [Oscillospiraceae bacterium]
MAQFINRIRVPGDGTIRHIAGFGHGDNGYDVLVTRLKNKAIPCVIYYYLEGEKKKSVTVAKWNGGYFIEYGNYLDVNSLDSYLNESCSLKMVSRKNLFVTVKAYRAYRMVFNEYGGVRDEIIDATKGLECIYLGNMARDRESLVKLLERIGFHPVTVDFNMITTKEGICIALDGICFKEKQQKKEQEQKDS